MSVIRVQLCRLALISALTGPVMLRAADNAADTAFFEKQVRPILVQRCYECHSTEAKKTKGGLALDTKAALQHGGDSGPALVPGDPEKSRLIEAIRYKNQDLQMPPKSPMPASEIAALEEWVKRGAHDPRDSGTAKAGAPAHLKPVDMVAGRKHWAFQPLTRLQGTRTLDSFLDEAITKAGLTPAPVAERATLIRRATFDLTGLPPTPEEVEAFVYDPSPNAFDRVIERLLASPQYGERWGRHWLDVARYADSNGLDENVALGHAWRYRDYVVKAFNADKPFDQFLIEQLAGDLVPNHDEDTLAATGFLNLGAKVLAEPDVQKLQLDIIDEQLDTLGKAFMGMTLGCVRCHDHKFDPITQADYYALAAIFRSTRSLADEKTGAIKYWYEHKLATPEQIEAKKAADKRATARKSELTAFTTKLRKDLRAELEAAAPQYLAAAAQLDAEPEFAEVEALATKAKLRPRYLLTCRQYLTRNAEHPFFAEWRKLAAEQRSADIRTRYTARFADKKDKDAQAALTDKAGFIAVPEKDADAFDAATVAKITAMQSEVMDLEDGSPDLPAIMGVTDGEVTRTMPIHLRGSYLTLGQPVERGFPAVMRPENLPQPVLPARQSGRLELARWMASAEHPLTARVMVNRLWRWHFGAGLVSSTDNFGLTGTKPSNPELLDWLSRRFIESGWSIKDMHRLIMRSAAYQRSSAPLAAPAMTADPENRLLARFPILRLEAEQVRDAMLSVSGWLDPKIGGKTIPLHNREFVFNHTSRDHTTYETPRRALYLPIIRNHLYDLLEQFDYPDPTMPTGSRNSTTVAPQALIMMNSPLVTESAQRLAARLMKSSNDDTARLRLAWQLLYARLPEPAEQSRADNYLASMKQGAPEQEAWELLCQSLLAANEFVYLR